MTISVVALNRPELIERRRERISIIHALVDRAARTTNANPRTALFNQLQIETDDSSEYALVGKTVKRLLLPD
jgi:hypothetical protein